MPRPLRVLLLSYYFPPMHDVGGMRAYSFAQHLPGSGIEVDAVVGATDETTNDDLLAALGPESHVTRVARWFAGPLDCSWNAVRTALRLARRARYDLILATGPPWATITAGLALSKLSGIPLVADFRDPWTSGGLFEVHGSSATARQLHRCWEAAVLRHAAGIVCVHPAAAARVRARLASRRRDRVVCIPNGHHEPALEPARVAGRDRCVFSHIGKLHPRLRPPGLVLDAFALACRDPGFAAEALFVHTGGGHEIEPEVRARNLEQQVVLAPPVSQRHALRLMRGADVLVLINLLQSEAAELPTAKIYDYLAARRPILGIVPDGGASAGLLARAPNAIACGSEDRARIADAFLTLWKAWRRNELAEHDLDLGGSSRRSRAGELATFVRTLVT